MRFFDTRTRRKREFKPVFGHKVGIYTCGPSVYAFSHIGNFRTYIFEDILVRYLIYKGYEVKRIMNITDVEDKSIIHAKKEGKQLDAIQKEKIKSFLSDFDELSMLRPTVIAKASEHIDQMTNLIERICKKGYCRYEKDGIYFNVRKFGRYGRLKRLKSKRYLGKMNKDDYTKVGLWDFRLWKYWTPNDGIARWESSLGTGRPGWHIECSAMAMHYLGDSFDIHCGGSDNIYPHHENEVAQSESASGKRLANFWLHAKHLTIEKKKMSKRTGNVLYVKQLKKAGVPPKCLRFYLTSERYRNPLDFSIEKFKSKVCDCEKTRKLLSRLKNIDEDGKDKKGKGLAKKLLNGFESAMDDDLNTKLAYKRIFAVMNKVEDLLKTKKLSKKDCVAIVRAMKKVDSVLCVF